MHENDLVVEQKGFLVDHTRNMNQLCDANGILVCTNGSIA